MDDFVAFEKLASIVSPPPEKVKPIKPSREDLMQYWHGVSPNKPLDKHYSIERCKKILKEKYHYKLIDITEYKGTRATNGYRLKKYRVEDDNGNVIIVECTLYQLGTFLENEGDYTFEEPKTITERYKADIYYFAWHGKPGRFRPTSKYLRDIYVEERGCFYYIYGEDGKYILKKKIGSEGTQVIRKDTKKDFIKLEETVEDSL